MRFEELIQEHAVALFSRTFLQWQGNQIPEAALGHRVLTWNNRSYESRPISCLFSMVRVSREHPSLLASAASTGRSKNIQMCAPFPDRDLSTTAGTWNRRHVSRNAAASAIHDFLSKSTARSQHISSDRSG